MKATTLFDLCVWLCALPVLAGCGAGTPKGHIDFGPVVPVQGKVTLGEKPLDGGWITFFSIDEKQKGVSVAEGPIDKQGLYSVKSEGKDGAPKGKWRIAVDARGEDRFQVDSKYATWRTSTLVIEVVDNPPPGAYDLKLPKTR
jgi:hypothetical protein